jgi:hypothetical protein
MRAPRKASSQVSWSLLTEGVTQARLEAHRLRLMLDRAMTLVETSPAKDHLWQVAGDLIQGFPERLSDLERALDRTSYALVVMGEEFLRGRIPADDRYVVDDATKTHPYAAPRQKGEELAARVARRFMEARWGEIKGVAPTAEDYFFDNPKKRETRQMAEAKALSNDPPVAAKAVKEMDSAAESVAKAKADAKAAPPTPNDNKKKPGGKQFSTLNRYLVDTEQPGVHGVPTHRDEIPKHEKPKGNL